MSGWKQWGIGEVVEAGDFQSFVQDQTVQRFATTAARSTALGTAVAEGMVSYVDAENQLTVYDGSQWQPVGAYSPNYIINGAFDIWQRGTSFSNPTNGSFAADRLYLGVGGTPTDVTVSQQTFSANELNAVGFGDAKYYVRLAIVDKGSMSVFNFRQYIEDVRTLAGQEVTFSFWAKADSARDVRIDLKQNFGSGGSSEVTYAGSTQALSTSWQRYSFNYSLNDLSGKTIGTGDKLYFVFELDESNGATYDIWGVQLEAGSVATPFRRHAPSLQGELAACQRYFVLIDPNASAALAFGFNISSTLSRFTIEIPVPMRATPTLNAAFPGSWFGTSSTPSGSPSITTSANKVMVNYNSTGGASGDIFAVVSAIDATLDAEL